MGSAPNTSPAPGPGLPPGVSPRAVDAVQKLVRPLERFMRVQAASGIILLVVTAIALAWANSPWKDSYHALWHTPISFGLGPWTFSRDLHFWINDGFMVIFFFVVGLEIRREMHDGELSDAKRAMLPAFAALGGMVAPALIYFALNRSPETRSGWGVPMATDIAFAVGVLALLGNRVAPALRVLLLALAIIDDIGAILVIAIFYSSNFSFWGLLLALAGVLIVIGLQRAGARRTATYILPGLVIWAGFLISGVHPTIAGVVIGLLTPVRSWFSEETFADTAHNAVERFRELSAGQHGGHHSPDVVHALNELNLARREALSPVVRLESSLNPWVAYGIMPLFALANAGVTIGSVRLDAAALPLAAGVAFGLLIGKPIGVVGASMLAIKLGISRMPKGVKLGGLAVVGLVAGIGFTMALFIAQLAFQSPAQLDVAKLAVLIGSGCAGVLTLVFGPLLLRGPREAGAAATVDEAEQSADV